MDEDTVKIALAETRDKVTELTAPLAEAADTVAATSRKNIGLTLVGGLAAGLAIGALLPLTRRRKPAKKTARALAATFVGAVSELTQTLAAQARERAETTADEAREKLGSAGKSIHDHSESLSKQASKLADAAADHLNDSGKAIARQVVKLVEKARR